MGVVVLLSNTLNTHTNTLHSRTDLFRPLFFPDGHRICMGKRNIWPQLRRQIIALNLFDSESNEIHTIQRERLSTRLYVLLLFITILTIITYTVLPLETVGRIDSTPSQIQYEKLLASGFNALQCPCTHISVVHKQFVTVNTTYHQVCSSDFVKEPWLDYLFADSYWYNYERSDIRVRGTAYFAFLSTLCTLSQTIITNAVEQFLMEEFVGARVMPESEFLTQMSIITEQFETTTPARFSRGLQLVRDVMHGNTFVSGYFLNWYWWVEFNRESMSFPTNAVTMKDGCSCGTRSDCTEPGGIHLSFSDTQSFQMPGLNVGCSVVETTLRSTLECLYNQTCINLLQHYAATVPVVLNNTQNVAAMNPTLPSRFRTNVVVQTMVDALFVDQWHINVTYSSFYNKCAPAYCSYTFEKHNNFLYIISRILGLYGGLTVSLHFIVPYIMKLLLKIRGRCCMNSVASVA